MATRRKHRINIILEPDSPGTGSDIVQHIKQEPISTDNKDLEGGNVYSEQRNIKINICNVKTEVNVEGEVKQEVDNTVSVKQEVDIGGYSDTGLNGTVNSTHKEGPAPTNEDRESNIESSYSRAHRSPVTNHCEQTHERVVSSESSNCIENARKSLRREDFWNPQYNQGPVLMDYNVAKSLLSTIPAEKEARGKTYLCEWCDYTTDGSHQLKLHNRTVHQADKTVRHSENKPHECTHCNFATDTVTSLKLHQRVHSREKKDAHCRKSRTVVHEQIKAAPKPYRCDACEYTCTLKEMLKLHIKHNHHVHGKPHECEVCNYSTDNPRNLMKHQECMRHSGEKSIFKCGWFCGFRCDSYGRLKVHENTHMGEKPYSCDLCDYVSAYQCNLTRHRRRIHTG